MSLCFTTLYGSTVGGLIIIDAGRSFKIELRKFETEEIVEVEYSARGNFYKGNFEADDTLESPSGQRVRLAIQRSQVRVPL